MNPSALLLKEKADLFRFLLWCRRPEIVAGFLTVVCMAVTPSAVADSSKNRPHAGDVGKSTTYESQKSTTYEPENRPANHGGVVVSGILSMEELDKLLGRGGWKAWRSRVRVNGLLLLVADALERAKAGRFTFGRDRARLLCSSLPRSLVLASEPREGLTVLTGLGVFVRDEIGCCYPCARTSEFHLGGKFAKRPPFKISLSLGNAMRRKWKERNDRVIQAFENKNPIIGIVRVVASRLKFPQSGLEAVLRLRSSDPDEFPSAERCFKALDGGLFKLTLDQMGTLHSPVSGCPRSVRPELVMDGEDTVEVDISGAHVVVLPKIFDQPFLKFYGIAVHPRKVAEERKSLIATVQSGDVYGGDGPDRKQRKKDLLTSLNIEAKIQMAMDVTERLLAGHPILRKVLWEVKRKNHRDLSQWLQRWVSDIVNPSVLALHENGIPSIPIVDCLLVRKRDQKSAVDELLRRLFEATGVCAMVGGVRYTPKDPYFTETYGSQIEGWDGEHPIVDGAVCPF